MTDQSPNSAIDNDALEKRDHAAGYLAHPAFSGRKLSGLDY